MYKYIKAPIRSIVYLISSFLTLKLPSRFQDHLVLQGSTVKKFVAWPCTTVIHKKRGDCMYRLVEGRSNRVWGGLWGNYKGAMRGYEGFSRVVFFCETSFLKPNYYAFTTYHKAVTRIKKMKVKLIAVTVPNVIYIVTLWILGI